LRAGDRSVWVLDIFLALMRDLDALVCCPYDDNARCVAAAVVRSTLSAMLGAGGMGDMDY
jgi:hypothetical protein